MGILANSLVRWLKQFSVHKKANTDRYVLTPRSRNEIREEKGACLLVQTLPNIRLVRLLGTMGEFLHLLLLVMVAFRFGNATRRRRTTTASSSSHSTGTRRMAIECQVQPLFKCPTCQDELQKEQDAVILEIQKRYPTTSILKQTNRLLNAIFVNVPVSDDDDLLVVNQFLLSLSGVLNIYPSEDVDLVQNEDDNNNNNNENDGGIPQIEDYSQPLLSIGVDRAHKEYCALGKGVKVAVLDSGVDYTHKSMGGPGTVEAFQAAYGTDIADPANKQRDGLFPTNVVTEGFDFLGDLFQDGESVYGADADNDPIDLQGHGTGVAHAVRAVAPAAEIIAVKICTTLGNTCPDFAYVSALEYILDPNDDGDTDDHVDIVNLSLGRLYASSYYSVLSRATEEVAEFGVLPVAAAGNSGNRPYILGGAAATPNALTVGATAVYQDEDNIPLTMASYSSRGPNESNHLKPDLVAPGGPFGLAEAATGTQFRRFEGTSFAAPLVAGGAALIKQKCPECSPFAIKALLMNHCHHDIQYRFDNDSTAPVTMQGSGQIQLDKSLAATFWAYSVEDVQPSIGFGIVNAAYDMVLKRRVRIIKLTAQTEAVTMGYEFRSNNNVSASAVSVKFTPETFTMAGDCQDGFFVDVEFQIDASKAPSSRLSSGGAHGADPESLDWNEVDGWLLLTTSNAEQQVGLPFHMVLRRAADVTVGTPTFNDTTLDMTKLPVELSVGLQNKGAEMAQIDAFELLFISTDDPENGYGISDPPSDIRYVGYRTVPVNVEGCTDLLEFAIHTWERQRTLSFTHFDILIDLDGDEIAEFAVFNTGYLVGTPATLNSEMHIINLSAATESCGGFAPDHATNTANSVLRLCTDDIGMEEGGVINLGVVSYSFPRSDRSDAVGWTQIKLPEAGLSTPSYNIEPGGTLEQITVSGTGTTPTGTPPLGLLLYTNSYRSPVRTGSATFTSEAIAIYRQGTALPQEYSLDALEFPVAQDLDGPAGCGWNEIQSQCSSITSRKLLDDTRDAAMAWAGDNHDSSIIDRLPSDQTTGTRDQHRHLQTDATCVEYKVPRAEVITVKGPEDSAFESAPTAAPILFIENDDQQPTRPKTSWDLDDKHPSSTVPPLPIIEWTSSSGIIAASTTSILLLLLVGSVPVLATLCFGL